MVKKKSTNEVDYCLVNETRNKKPIEILIINCVNSIKNEFNDYIFQRDSEKNKIHQRELNLELAVIISVNIFSNLVFDLLFEQQLNIKLHKFRDMLEQFSMQSMDLFTMLQTYESKSGHYC